MENKLAKSIAIYSAVKFSTELPKEFLSFKPSKERVLELAKYWYEWINNDNKA